MSALLRSDVIVLELLLQLAILLFSSLLNPEAPDQKYQECHERDSANDAACYRTDVRSVMCRRRWSRGILNACHACAILTILRYERAYLGAWAIRTCEFARRADHTSFENGPKGICDCIRHAISLAAGHIRSQSQTCRHEKTLAPLSSRRDVSTPDQSSTMVNADDLRSNECREA